MSVVFLLIIVSLAMLAFWLHRLTKHVMWLDEMLFDITSIDVQKEFDKLTKELTKEVKKGKTNVKSSK